jgi:hypothetical protein
MRTVSVAQLVLALVVGCAADTTSPGTAGGAGGSAGGKADDDSLVTLAFAADWSETQSAPLQSGAAVRVDYDVDRLPDCRGTQAGVPQWQVSAIYWGADGEEQTLGLSEIAGDEVRPVDAVLTVPEGDSLEMYFYVSNRWGCIAYDSDFGANYHFDVEPRSTPATLVFSDDFEEPVLEGTLSAGGSVVVEYDLERLAECRSTRGAYPVWDVTVRHRFDGYGRDQESSVTRSSAGGREPAPVTIRIPAEAGELELTFRNFDIYGCEAWDPAGGESYRFALSR